jgi:hypothetical protein
MRQQYFSKPITRVVSQRRRREKLLRLFFFPLLWVLGTAALIAAMTGCIFALDEAWAYLKVSSADLAIEGADCPRLQGAVVGLLAFFTLAAVWLAALWIRRWDDAAANQRFEQESEFEVKTAWGRDSDGKLVTHVVRSRRRPDFESPASSEERSPRA